MTLGTLILYIGIAALVLTIAIGITKKGQIKWLISFLQNFSGVLFCFSGYVKAVDPMGTAFKMEQYFAEFEATLSPTWFGFVAPLFPWLSEHAIGFSVFMIVLEIIVGLMLILGHKTKFTAWVFLVTLVFFTILTGFTFLTGYVPTDANFFTFNQWVSYDVSNMRVTDCGCFGDFIKLEPKTSFFKDIALLVPGILFVLQTKKMHELFTPGVRNIIVIAATILLLIFCMRNYKWDLPVKDFRPFREGVDIYTTKMAEQEGAGNTQIIAYKLKNLGSGEQVSVPFEEYMANYNTTYTSDKWEVLDQVKSEPAVAPTKISDFEIYDADGGDISEEILTAEAPMLMIVCYKLKGDVAMVQRETVDSIFRFDTLQLANDSVELLKVLDRVEKSVETVPEYTWEENYLSKFSEKIIPLVTAASEDGVSAFGVAGGAGDAGLRAFRGAIGGGMPFYEADDIMLKTIIWSNPGVVLLQNGVIVGTWHIAKTPD